MTLNESSMKGISMMENDLVGVFCMIEVDWLNMTDYGRMMNNSLMQYKIPTRLDVGTIRVEFESSYEPTGPFGAKSIGEIVINTPSPAISNAIQNATGVIIRELPMTAEKIYRGICGR